MIFKTEWWSVFEKSLYLFFSSGSTVDVWTNERRPFPLPWLSMMFCKQIIILLEVKGALPALWRRLSVSHRMMRQRILVRIRCVLFNSSFQPATRYLVDFSVHMTFVKINLQTTGLEKYLCIFSVKVPESQSWENCIADSLPLKRWHKL